jgi:hypothetical protein
VHLQQRLTSLPMPHTLARPRPALPLTMHCPACRQAVKVRPQLSAHTNNCCCCCCCCCCRIHWLGPALPLLPRVQASHQTRAATAVCPCQPPPPPPLLLPPLIGLCSTLTGCPTPSPKACHTLLPPALQAPRDPPRKCREQQNPTTLRARLKAWIWTAGTHAARHTEH